MPSMRNGVQDHFECPWLFTTLLGPRGIRSFSGDQARELVFQERLTLENLDEQGLSFVWCSKELHRDVDFRNPTHLAVIGGVMRYLLSDIPSQLDVKNFREPIARCITYLAAMALVEYFKKVKGMHEWVPNCTRREVGEQCIQLVLARARREQPYWKERSLGVRYQSHESDRYESESFRQRYKSILEYYARKYKESRIKNRKSKGN